LAGAPPGQMRGAWAGVYPLRYSSVHATTQMTRRRPAPEGCEALARWLRYSSVRDRCGYLPSSSLASEPNPQQQNRNLFLHGP
ncbi:MAG TPA: hypothetical protein P5186_28355, partial [Candidatus Paceibacterota bacterium]|nr:hypothetical protein [Candidatus Paceibacterota bacterium]